MADANIKSDLKQIAEHLPASASYADAMYELYVRMKISHAKQAADEGRVIPHEEVKRRFVK
jgi:predicted transcriptional regulator